MPLKQQSTTGMPAGTGQLRVLASRIFYTFSFCIDGNYVKNIYRTWRARAIRGTEHLKFVNDRGVEVIMAMYWEAQIYETNITELCFLTKNQRDVAAEDCRWAHN